MIRIAVCDDETDVLARMERMLYSYKKETLSVDCYTSGTKLLASSKQYDIIFLDIDMPGMNGIKTAEQIRRGDREVTLIYVTNYTDYTIFAFAVHAFAYLLKPVEQDTLFGQLEEALLYQRKTKAQELEFTTQEGIIRVDPAEILYFEYQNRMVLMKTTDGIRHWKRRITEVAEKMKAYDFVMPHKSFVVNLYAVQSIHGYDIILTDGSTVPLSQKKSVGFRRSLNRYLAREGGIR